MEMIKCPECGKEVSDRISVCPYCGYENVHQNEHIDVNEKNVLIYKNKKYIGILMCIIGCILLIASITCVTNDDYKFYKQHYQDCRDGYRDNKSTANSYVDGFFRSSYNSIASSYKKLADSDNKKLWGFRVQAIILLFGGIILNVGGYKIYKKEIKDNGISKMS